MRLFCRSSRPAALLVAGPFLALLFAVLFAVPGCVLHAPDAARTHRAFQRQYPKAQFDRQVTLDLGPLTMAMAVGLTRRWAPEAFAEFGPYLRWVERMEVGVYAVRDLPPLERVDAARLPVLREGGWETVVRIREPKEHVWILARTGRRSLRALHLVVLGPDELVAARVEGRLEKIVAQALQQRGGSLRRATGDAADAAGTPAR